LIVIVGSELGKEQRPPPLPKAKDYQNLKVGVFHQEDEDSKIDLYTTDDLENEDLNIEDLEDEESQDEDWEDGDGESNEECLDRNQSNKEVKDRVSKNWWDSDS